MVQRALLLLGSAAAWFATTDDDLRTWLGAHPPYLAQTEAEARQCGAAQEQEDSLHHHTQQSWHTAA